jgi:hypothetical protein
MENEERKAVNERQRQTKTARKRQRQKYPTLFVSTDPEINCTWRG